VAREEAGDRGVKRGEGMIRTYRDLIVWQKEMNLAMEVYSLAGRLPARRIPAANGMATDHSPLTTDH